MQLIFAGVLGGILVLVLVYQFIPSSSTSASTSSSAVAPANGSTGIISHPTTKASKSSSGKKEKLPQSLDPTLQLQQLAVIEQIKYEGSGRNIFISEAEPVIPMPVAPGQTGPGATAPEAAKIYTPPSQPAPAPIPLKFFGFASKPGEPKKIFLSKGEDVFIAGEGEVIDRRYKVVRISANSVEIQDVVSSGPPQSIPLTQG
jgi:hypothetical protein